MSLTLKEFIEFKAPKKFVAFLLDVTEIIFNVDDTLITAQNEYKAAKESLELHEWVEDFYSNLPETGKQQHSAMARPFIRQAAANILKHILEDPIDDSSVFQLDAIARETHGSESELPSASQPIRRPTHSITNDITCPVCYEIMIGINAPSTIGTCGHTICLQ